MATVYLGLGTNLGQREENLKRALELLAYKVKVEEVSTYYETEPMGFKEQPLFLNAVCRASTDLKPQELLSFIKEIEEGMGRKKSFRNAPREIDIDILLYDDLRMDSAELTIPHPHLTERAFVLAPLAEIAPELVEPISGKSITRLLAEVDGREGVRRTGSRGRPIHLSFISNLGFVI